MNLADSIPLSAVAARDSDDLVALAPSLLSPPTSLTPMALLTPTVGRLQGIDTHGKAQVQDLPACPGQTLVCRSTVPLQSDLAGREVLVVFEGGDVQRPIIVGVLQTASPPLSVQADGQRQVIEAEREIILKCGAASITLTRAGRIVIKGSYVLSRSSGVNKIKGAAVDIN